MEKKYPHPLKPEVLVTSKHRWQIEQVMAGLCRICRAPRNLFAQRCDACQRIHRDKSRVYRREKLGCQPWRPGGPGRPPKNMTPVERIQMAMEGVSHGVA